MTRSRAGISRLRVHRPVSLLWRSFLSLEVASLLNYVFYLTVCLYCHPQSPWQIICLVMPPLMQMFSLVIKPALSLQSMTQNYSYISYRGIFKSKNMHSGQEKAANPAQNGIPSASRAEKHPNSCAEDCKQPPQVPPAPIFFCFWQNCFFLRKISRINLPYRFRKPFEIHRFAK